MCIRADGHRREKRTVSQKLPRSIHQCQHLMNKYAESKALILAVADDDQPLLQRQKDAKTSKKLRGESKLQREAVAKADQAEEDVCCQQALRLGNQDAEQAMAIQDMADLDYDPHSGSEASNSDEEKVGSSSGASNTSDSESSNSSFSTSSASSSSSSSSAAAVNAGTSKKKCTTKKAYPLNVSLPLKIKLKRRQRPCNLEGIPTEFL